MKTDKLIELIDNSELMPAQKMFFKGLIQRSDERIKEREFIQQISNEKYINEVHVSTDDVKIYDIQKKIYADAPYRFIYRDKDGKWRNGYSLSPSIDIAYLAYLELKYLGDNSRFTQFAMKMLEIKF